MAPAFVQPADAAGAAAALKSADADRLAVAIQGAGTKQGGTGTRVDVIVSTLGLTAGIDHVPGDLVATAPAGVTLDALNAVLRRERQWLPLDPPEAGTATIGGIVAANDSGPRRHRYGTPRDLIIGIEIALVDGRTARAGGRVVKNVAGYDLSKLLCGSLGSLAVITSATFKLAPAPQTSTTLVAAVDGSQRLSELALALSHSPLTPSAVELQTPSHQLLIRFETSPRATETQVAGAIALCQYHGASTQTLTGDDEARLWQEHGKRASSGDAVVKIAALPTDLAVMLTRIETLAAAHRVDYTVTGRAALGVIVLCLGGDVERQAAIVSELRREAAGRGGGVVLVSATAELKARVGIWGARRDSAAIMRAVKARFDPHGTLNPGHEPWESPES
jgi:glycolate oxidase FAD binding subunit